MNSLQVHCGPFIGDNYIGYPVTTKLFVKELYDVAAFVPLNSQT